jgi:gliding motility-associated lipoprotein GldD
MKYLSLLTILLFCSCQKNHVPKPKAQLRLSYPEANYRTSKSELPFQFDLNAVSDSLKITKLRDDARSYGVNIEYPSLKGTIYLTYKPVTDSLVLNRYLIDAQNFTQEHTKIADEIEQQVYVNASRNVFGMFYEVGGNAASQSQFYVTDSTKHFLTGSLYFYARPNYDSILPAAHYLKKDIKQIMESITWK